MTDRPTGRFLALASVVLAAVFLAYLAIGSVTLPVPELLRTIASGGRGSDAESAIVWQIRMPRAVAGAAVGSLLAVVGACFQALFRNPLAEPTLIGVSSGASVGGTLAILLGLDTGLGRVALACACAFGSLILVLAFARRGGRIDVQTMIVAGVVLGSLLAGLTTLNLVLAGQDSGKVLRWLLGSTTPMFWDRAVVLVLVSVVGGWVLYRQGRALNAFAVSEFMAERLGVGTTGLMWLLLCVGSLMTGVAVGTVGIVGFVGLVAPHIARRVVGQDVRRVMPMAAVLGATLVLFSDLLAQRLVPGGELPLGSVTAALGSPALLWLLKRRG